MNCNEFRRRLSLAVESQEALPTERNPLQQHAHDCLDAKCQQLWADDELLAGVVPGWREAVPQISLAERVLAELGQSRTTGSQGSAAVAGPRPVGTNNGDRSFTQPQATRLTRSWLACAAVVACLVLLIPLLHIGGQARMPGQPVAENATSAGTPQRGLIVHNNGVLPRQNGVSPPQEDPAAVSEAIRTYAGVPQTATEFVTDTVAMLLPEDLSGPDEAEPSRPAQWRGRLSEQLEPWSRELGTAFDAFLETVSDPPSSSRLESPRTVARPLSA